MTTSNEPHSFIETDRENPHIARRRAIRKAHPEVRSLVGRNPFTACLVFLLVSLHVGIAATLFVLDAPWWMSLVLAWAVGAFIAHALFAAMHEASHRLVFGNPVLDRVVLLRRK